MLSSLAAGGSIACAPGFEAPSFFRWLEELEPTWFTAVPTIHGAILQYAAANRSRIERARSRLRFVRASSARLSPALFEALEATFGVPVIESYGMTEVDQIACNPLPPAVRKIGSVGLPGGPEVAILDGEVVVRGANVIASYEAPDEVNARSFRDGWFRTGDRGYFDRDGYLFLTGRIKELVNRGGEKISPYEVEEVLASHAAVREALVGPIAHPQLGEDVIAAVVLQPGAPVSEEALRAFVLERLAPFKVPASIRFVEELPRGPTGKLLRLSLAKHLGLAVPENEARAERIGREHGALERKLIEIWQQVLEVESIGLDDDFLALGGTSLLAQRLIAAIESAFGARVPPEVTLEASTIAQLSAALRRRSWPSTEVA
jgi:acyl-CoA synthetase (AMP-forming)/AMP-acid ligase II/acyl carrier protein